MTTAVQPQTLTPADPAASEVTARHHALRVFDPAHRAELAKHVEAAGALLFATLQGLEVAASERGLHVAMHASTTIAGATGMLADLQRWVADNDLWETPKQVWARHAAVNGWDDDPNRLALVAA